MTEVEKLNLEKIKEIAEAMTPTEQREVLKVCTTDALMDELADRQDKMQRQIADIKKVLGVL
ncbi:MAG: hypothetical protein MJ007_02110 [Paludibacteraceae bacterium]|nr:hypothetical protein [Paludibacteraceae bacterium]